MKNLPANAGDTGDASSILGLGRSPGRGNGNPHQYSCLGNSTDRGSWGATVHEVTESKMTEHTHTPLLSLTTPAFQFTTFTTAGVIGPIFQTR